MDNSAERSQEPSMYQGEDQSYQTAKDAFLNEDADDDLHNLMTNQKNLIPFIDIFEKTGEPVRRINIQQILKEHGMTMQNISHIIVPRLEWSARINVQNLIAMTAK